MSTCRGTTKLNKPCNRKSNDYCYQHLNQKNVKIIVDDIKPKKDNGLDICFNKIETKILRTYITSERIDIKNPYKILKSKNYKKLIKISKYINLKDLRI